MLVEAYGKVSPEVIDLYDINGQQDREARQERYRELGMNRIRAWANEGERRVHYAGVAYDKLTPKQVREHRASLPTTVPLRDYRDDTPPWDALEALKDAKDLGCFDSIEIWTSAGTGLRNRIDRWTDDSIKPKHQPADPKQHILAVGVVTDASGSAHYYPIVRWGNKLRSSKANRRRRWLLAAMKFSLFVLLPVLLAAFLIGLYVVGIITFGIWTMLAWTFIPPFVLFIAFLMLAAA